MAAKSNVGSRNPAGHPFARRRGWLFDLDGTLIDSSPGVILAFHAAQQAFGEPPADPEAIRSRIGYPLVDTVRALSKVDYAQFIECFRREALASMHLHSRLLPGARDLLDQLANLGRLCALVTSKRTDIAQRIVDHLEIGHRFLAVIGSDAAADVKPHPAPLLEAARRLSLDKAQLVMVGDTQNDIQAARAAGLPVIALASGHDTRERLDGADLCFEDATELLEFVRIAPGGTS